MAWSDRSTISVWSTAFRICPDMNDVIEQQMEVVGGR